MQNIQIKWFHFWLIELMIETAWLMVESNLRMSSKYLSSSCSLVSMMGVFINLVRSGLIFALSFFLLFTESFFLCYILSLLFYFFSFPSFPSFPKSFSMKILLPSFF